MTRAALLLVLLCVPIAFGVEGEIFHNVDPEFMCATRFKDGLDDCREERRFGPPWGFSWMIYSPNPGRLIPAVACVDGHESPDGDPTQPPGELEWAEQVCNRTNVILKHKLKRCVEKGIAINTTPDVDDSCPDGNMVEVHEITNNAVCEFDNPKVTRDAGNGWFSTCSATGPGPAGVPDETWTPWNEAGCCLIGMQVEHPERGWELDDWQLMAYDPLVGNDESWDENFLPKTDELRVYSCNPPDVEDDESFVHYYCAGTSQDIMVEGWQNPHPNYGHQGPGWCNVTTGSYNPDLAGNVMDQVFNDLTVAVEQMGKPKGIVDPLVNQSYHESDLRYACRARETDFHEYCGGDDLVNSLQFAHSMGAIVSGVWGYEFTYFGGAVRGPNSFLSFRNNCDPVPPIVNRLHPLAIYHWALMSFDGVTREGHYRWCDEEGVTTDCVKRKAAGYLGRPLGPAGCGGEKPCEYAAWCDWNPYDPEPVQVESGREGFHPDQCDVDVGNLVDEVYACWTEDGLDKVLHCLMTAWAAVRTALNFGPGIEDHAFDDSNDWGGYRHHTEPNWDVERVHVLHGIVPVIPDVDPPNGPPCEGEVSNGSMTAICVD